MQEFQLFKLRDIGSALTESLNFIQKDKTFLKKILIGIIPLYAIIGVFSGFMMKDITQIITSFSKEIASGGGSMGEEMINEFRDRILSMDYTKIGLLYFSVVLGSVIMSAIAASFSFNYVKAKASNEELTDEKINSFFTKDLGWYLGYSILIGFLFTLIMGVGILIIAGISIASKGLGVLLIFPLFIAMMYFSITYLTMFYPVCFLEDLNFGQALSRSAALMKGYFWETLGFLLLMGLAIGFTSSTVSMIMSSIGSAFGILGSSLFSQVAQYAITGAGAVFMHVGYTLWYGNLRSKHEGIGRGGYSDLIDEIGKKDF